MTDTKPDLSREAASDQAALQPAAPQPTPEVEAMDLVERAFKAGIAYSRICDVTDDDEAWRTSQIRQAALARGSVAEKGELT